jgi:hypothetical protein
LRARIEELSALSHAGQRERAQPLWREALRLAEQRSDHGAQGDLVLLFASWMVDERDLDTALDAARSAAQHALDGVLPDLYVGASFAASEIAEKKGDREQAYGLLVTAWSTLSDLMGKELAEATVSPRLRDLAKRWGEPEFRRVRDAWTRGNRREGDRGGGRAP